MKFCEDVLSPIHRDKLKEKGYFLYYTAEAYKYTPVEIDEIIVIDKPSSIETYTSIISTDNLSEQFIWTGNNKCKFMLLKDLEKIADRVESIDKLVKEN